MGGVQHECSMAVQLRTSVSCGEDTHNIKNIIKHKQTKNKNKNSQINRAPACVVAVLSSLGPDAKRMLMAASGLCPV
jgi:hypothetical protein